MNVLDVICCDMLSRSYIQYSRRRCMVQEQEYHRGRRDGNSHVVLHPYHCEHGAFRHRQVHRVPCRLRSRSGKLCRTGSGNIPAEEQAFPLEAHLQERYVREGYAHTADSQSPCTSPCHHQERVLRHGTGSGSVPDTGDTLHERRYQAPEGHNRVSRCH